MRFGKTKQISRKTENDDRRYEKYKQTQHSYKQIKSIKMIGQRQLQDKKTYLEMITLQGGELFEEKRAGRSKQKCLKRYAKRE